MSGPTAPEDLRDRDSAQATRRAAGGAPQPHRAPRAGVVEQRRFRRSLVLLGLTLVLPGSAQLIGGHRRVGRGALTTFLVLGCSAGLVLLLVDPASIAGWLVRSWVLTALRAGALVLAVGWAALFVDAWRLGRPAGLSRRHQVLASGIALALSLGVAVPFGYAAHYATITRDELVGLFPDAESAAVGRHLNILLIGADAGRGRVGLRPDSLHLVSVDVPTSRPVVFSLPRNLERARFPSGTPAAAAFPDGFSGPGNESDWLLNATWTYAVAHPATFPGRDGPGPTAVMQAVSGTLGIPVHYYVLVDLKGFERVVDAIGGLELTVPRPLPIGNKGRYLQAGTRRLDGYDTLWFARSRKDSSDFDRMARQRCVIEALARQVDPATVLRNFEALATSTHSMIRTDIPRDQLPDLVQLALRARGQHLRSVQFVPPLIHPGRPNVPRIQSIVQRELLRTESSAASPSPSAKPSSAAPRVSSPAAKAPVDSPTPPPATSDVAATCG